MKMDWNSFFLGAGAGVVLGVGVLLTWAMCVAASMADAACGRDRLYPDAEGTELRR